MTGPAQAAIAGASGADNLVITANGATRTVIVESRAAGPFEQKAADDLARYVEAMSGARPRVLREPAEIAQALAGDAPILVLGEQAFELEPDLRLRLVKAAKQNATLRADAIVLRRDRNRVFVAGTNDRAHYFAAAALLSKWGARWYMPGQFGEYVPSEPDLQVGALDEIQAPPFEVRTYWVSWLGDRTGIEEFQLRNMMTPHEELVPTFHSLGQYTAGLGQGPFDFPITAPETAAHVARQVAPLFARSENFSLGMEDGLYTSSYPRDHELMRLQWDAFFMRGSVTDPMLDLYNNVLTILQREYPESRSKVGFLAYSNMTMPPVRPIKAHPALFAELAPIAIDPIHGMDDPRSPDKQEYRGWLYRWADVMEGRLTIYDYDQSMLVWRDLPNPSHMSFRQDVQHYRRAGILGLHTESRNALATTFLNLFLRAQLLWNPDVDVDALLSEFYTKFYGPAAAPMRDYWTAIFNAWSDTIVTEHEFFVVPAIYTPSLLDHLREKLAQAEELIPATGAPASKQDHLLRDRMRFTRLGFEVLDAYVQMVAAAATEGDYAKAIAAGKRGLTARQALTAMNASFTTTQLETGEAWWPGEVQQYRDLEERIDGPKGKLLQRLPLELAVRRDPDRNGEQRGYATERIDLSFWRSRGVAMTPEARKDYPNEWEMLRTDLYAQAQGVRLPDARGFVGDLWYRATVTLAPAQAGSTLHLMLPGVFGSCRLYVDGVEAARREQKPLWWENDYRFEWDIALGDKLKAGGNELALACGTEGHFGGLFRRPFLYRAAG